MNSQLNLPCFPDLLNDLRFLIHLIYFANYFSDIFLNLKRTSDGLERVRTWGIQICTPLTCASEQFVLNGRCNSFFDILAKFHGDLPMEWKHGHNLIWKPKLENSLGAKITINSGLLLIPKNNLIWNIMTKTFPARCWR